MGFIYSQLFLRPTYPTTSYAGQTIVVTGANVGLGLEAARHFVRLGAAKVIIACRSLERGGAAKRDIEASLSGKQGIVEVWPLDLARYDSVKAFAKRASELPRLDVVVENAGKATPTFSIEEEDESTITVNVVSTMLLALLLLPIMRKSAQRNQTTTALTIVTSEVHGWTDLPERKASDIFATLSDPKTAQMAHRYPVSKLLEVFAVRELAPRISASSSGSTPDVILNMVNPGLCHSSLARDVNTWTFWLMKLLLARTTEVGSRTLVGAAGAGIASHGKYYSDTQIKDHEISPFVQSAEGKKTQERVWQELTEKLEKIQPGVMKVVA